MMENEEITDIDSTGEDNIFLVQTKNKGIQEIVNENQMIDNANRNDLAEISSDVEKLHLTDELSHNCDQRNVDFDHEKDGITGELDSDNKENSHITTLIVPQRTNPIVHTPVEKPRCPDHLTTEVLKTECEVCFDLISEPQTTIPQIFGAMREWLPGNQRNMNLLVDEILKRGAHIDDMDGLEGNTMLHYACKSGSEGVGSTEMATHLVKKLLDKGANYKLRSRWTDMLPLHYAAYFNCPEILEVLLDASKNADIDARCKEYDQGTALHMAAAGLCYNAANFLIGRGADPTLINNKFKTPYQCIAEGTKHDLRQSPELIEQLNKLLKNAKSPVSGEVLQDIGLSIGDNVLVGGEKSGTLKFCGKTDFASGVWCGVELHENIGKNDGSVAGVTYFKSKAGYGMFAPPSKVTMLDKKPSLSASQDTQKTQFKVNDRVSVIGYKLGTIRFIGKVKFAGGVWYGVELDRPYGKCNGTLDNVKYFTCKPQHGVLVTGDKVKRSDKAEPNKRETPMSPKLNNRMPGSPITHLDSNRAPVCLFPMKATPIKGTRSSPTVIATTPPTSGAVRRNSGSRTPRSRGVSPTRGLANSPSTDSVYNKQIKLQPGMNAFVNGELGTVKYVGRVDFSDGIWVGVHLKNQNGKNDGTVMGKKYFVCKPGYGIMVKPNKVTIHGINASKLIDEKDYPA